MKDTKEEDGKWEKIIKALAKVSLDEWEEVLEKDIKKFTPSGAHIVLQKKHEGKKARVMIRKQKEEDDSRNN